MRIVFMGTPEFAVPSLAILLENDLNVVGVITAPDKPSGRGKRLNESAVKQFASQKGLHIMQPTNLKSPEFIEELRALNADLQIVVAFRMLPEVVWDMPKHGTFNLHASLLPQYRGAAPINWAIINGESKTGVTTFFLKHEIDTGNIAFQEEEIIDQKDNVGSLYGRLMEKGSNLVLKTVNELLNGNLKLTPQNEQGELRSAPKIHKETCEIDWSKSAREINDFVRGLSPYPAAWTLINGKKYKVYEVEVVDASDSENEAGSVISGSEGRIYIQTGNGILSILELQAEGKKRMLVKDYLRGNIL